MRWRAQVVWGIAGLGVLILFSLQLIIAESLILLENRYPEKTRQWLTVLGALPVAGFILYLLMGLQARRGRLFPHKHAQGKKIKQIADKQKSKLQTQHVMLGENQDYQKKLTRLILANASSHLTINNETILLTNGREKFRALREELEGASHHIHAEYYIFRDDKIGREIQDLLSRKSREGVQVRLLLDGVGSKGLPTSFLKSLKEEGIEVGVFFPIRFPYIGSRVNYRNHRKIVVIDGKTGFLGGMNVGDEYLSRDPRYGFWRDTHLRIKGEAVHVLQTTFLNDWIFCTKREVGGEEYYPTPGPSGNQLTQIIASGPDSKWYAFKQVLFAALAGATKKIYITTPYLVPDESMLTMLQTAALSGLEVKVLVQGVPDHRIVYWASRSYFQELLEAGVEIYQYQKGILHAKIVTVDGFMAFVGSANFDIRSFELDLEVTAAIYDSKLVNKLEREFENDLSESEQVELDEFRERGLRTRLLEAHARLVAPLL